MGWGAAAGIGAGIIGEYLGAREANEASARDAQKNRDFQEYMSNTSHQREVNDLRAAGLNPILAANKGASTPSGASYTAQNAAEGLGTTAISAVALKQAAVKQEEEIKAIQSGTDKQKEEISLMKSQQGVNEGTKQLQADQATAARAQAAKSAIEAQVIRKGIPAAEVQNEIYDLIRPGVKKAKEFFGTGAKSQWLPDPDSPMARQADKNARAREKQRQYDHDNYKLPNFRRFP